MYYLDGRWRRQSLVYFGKPQDHPRMSRAVPSGRREGMFPGRYSEIFGLGERLGCILNFGHSFDAIGGVSLSLLETLTLASSQ